MDEIFKRLTPGKIEFDASNITSLYNSRLAHVSFRFRTLAFQQVTTTCFGTNNFPCCCDFESLGNRLLCFTTCDCFWHGSGKLTASDFRGKIFFILCEQKPPPRWKAALESLCLVAGKKLERFLLLVLKNLQQVQAQQVW